MGDNSRAWGPPFVAGESTGNHKPEIAPYGVYQAKDGWFNLAVGTNVLWQRFLEAVGAQALLDDPRFASNHERSLNCREMNAELDKIFMQHTVRELEAKLIPAGVPIGEIHDLASVLPTSRSRRLTKC